jgi:UDP-N-acetylglucosamine--N-acetylmuramyl-(pentapeptide) pyrophosphoryl-undecaprenol N-acetylglucosamine transferase
LQRGEEVAFVRGFVRSYREAKKLFREQAPDAVLGMGGFTSAPAILAAKRCGVQTFLHESNRIAGRANRWLSRVVTEAFVGFPNTRGLSSRRVRRTGTPVRPEFNRCVSDKVQDFEVEHQRVNREEQTSNGQQSNFEERCRRMLGLDSERPVVVVVGGSQGASGLNELVEQALPVIADAAPEVQWFHLAGQRDVQKVKETYSRLRINAVVQAFSNQMDQVLGAATVAVSRAGASSLAELAAMRVPAVLVPYPAATDNHQFFNARAFVKTGAARMIEQRSGTGEELAWLVLGLLGQPGMREQMQQALARWHSPRAAEEIVKEMLNAKG